MFALAGAEHEFANGFSGIFALLKDEFHLLGDGHLDTAFASELEGGSGGENTFSHLSAETLEDFGELAAFTERLTDGSVDSAERSLRDAGAIDIVVKSGA